MAMAISAESVALAACRLCGSESFQFCLSAPDFDTGRESFDLYRCCGCGLVRIEPLPDEAELTRYYCSTYYGSGQRKFVSAVERITRWYNEGRARNLVQWLIGQGRTANISPRVLDIGCGRGGLLRALARLGCECHGVERADFPPLESDAGFCLHRRPLLELAFPSAHFDIIVVWHVLEHLPDPGATLAEIYRLLRPGGLLALAVPNFASWQRHLFGPDWFHLDLPRHLHHFGLPVLREALEGQGFQVVATGTRAFDQNAFGFVQSVFNHLCRTYPNRLYQRLRQPEDLTFDLELLLWLTGAGLLAPFAGVEYMLSGLLGWGATAIVYVSRR